jgi:galactoside O-acetyltransferase
MSKDGNQNPFNPGYYFSDELEEFGFRAVGLNVMVARNTTIIGLELVTLGSNIRIDGFTTISTNGGSLKIGNNVHIGAGCYFTCANNIKISDFANISQGVRIYSSSDDYSGRYMTSPMVSEKFSNIHKGEVLLGRHVIVGSGSVILPSVTIGDGTAVGAMSLVKTSLPEWGIYAGIPARFIKERSKNLLEFE